MKKIIIFFFSFLFLSASASSHVTHYQQFKSIEMEIFRNDKLIGINNFYFSKENNLMKVKNIVQFKISIAGIDLMKVDSESAGIEKLLGGGKMSNAYSVKVENFTASAEEKLKAVGGEIFQSVTEEKPAEE